MTTECCCEYSSTLTSSSDVNTSLQDLFAIQILQESSYSDMPE